MKSIAFLNNNNKQTEIKNFKYNNIYHCPKDNEILVNKSEKKTCTGSVWWKLQNDDERNQRWNKRLDRYIMFMDWKAQYDKSVSST